MRILIVGAGAIGSKLAEQLSQEQHDVSVVDSDLNLVKELGQKLDAMIVEGNGASPQVLEQAGIREAEMVIAVTNSDELNMIVSLMARNYGVKTRIARIRNPEYTVARGAISQHQLMIDRIINPEEIAVAAMEQLIFTAGATEVATFADDRILCMGFLVPEDAPIQGRKLREVREIVPDEFLMVAIHRGTEVIIPRGEDMILPGDRIYVILPRDLVDLFLGQLYRRIEKVRKVVIYGATRMGISLAKRLEQRIGDVTLLDPDQQRCEEAAKILEKVTVLRGIGTDPDLLEEIRVGHAQAFCAVMDDDASNVMSSLLAKEHQAKKTIVIINEPDFVPIAERIGLDAPINPRLLAANHILDFVRSGPTLAAAHLSELKAEVEELEAKPNSAVVQRPIAELAQDFPKDAIIGMILRGDRIVIPRGNTTIEPFDRVIVFSKSENVSAVQDMFTDQARKKAEG